MNDYTSNEAHSPLNNTAVIYIRNMCEMYVIKSIKVNLQIQQVKIHS